MKNLKLPLKILSTLTLALLISLLYPVFDTKATGINWIGGNGNWEDASNWSTGIVPTENDDVIIDSNVTVNLNSSQRVHSLTIGDDNGIATTTLNFNYESIDTNSPLYIEGGDLTLNANSTITHTAANNDTLVGNVYISLNTGTATINGSINILGKGYKGGGGQANGYGPGAGIYTGGEAEGGSHGGVGCYYSYTSPRKINRTFLTRLYDDFKDPTMLGSGGSGSIHNCIGGAGGGAVKIVTSNKVIVNGAINANGANGYDAQNTYSSGAGAGGSVNIDTNILEGNGSITANGGNSLIPGGGGFISIKFNTDNSSLTTVSASTSDSCSANGSVYYSEKDASHLYLKGNQTWYSGDNAQGEELTIENVTLEENANLKIISYYTNDTDGRGFVFNVSNFITEPNSIINLNGEGYKGGVCSTDGMGPGKATVNNGASHGGLGAGSNQTYLYDSIDNPVNLGSGGAGGYWNNNGCLEGDAGGGAIIINASNRTRIDGTITSNGNPGRYQQNIYSSSGGSGGSININTNIFDGEGIITANGSSVGITSGGGRIAIKFNEDESSLSTLSASAMDSNSENGTVYYYDKDNDHLYINHNQSWRANPSLEGSEQNIKNITVNDNIRWKLYPYYTDDTDGIGFVFNVDNFNINTGAIVDGTGLGYQGGSCQTNGTGPGKGIYNGYAGSANHGGVGQEAYNNNTYGDENYPLTIGSGSSGATSACGNCHPGVNGGGAIMINATGDIKVDGAISMNGADGYEGAYCWYTGASGSGGSVYIKTTNILGSGNITADGGKIGYAGGGGRIAIYYTGSNSLTGDITANGGNSYATNGSNLRIQKYKPDTSIEQPYLNPLPQKEFTLKTIFTDNDGVGDIENMYFKIINPDGENIEYLATNGSNSTDLVPTAISGSQYIYAIKYDRELNTPTEKDITITWHIKTNWNWTPSQDIEVATYATDSFDFSNTYTPSTDFNLKYDNRLTFTGSLITESLSKGLITATDWLPGDDTLTVSGLNVVYNNTDVSPENDLFDIEITDTLNNIYTQTDSAILDLDIPTGTTLQTNNTHNIDIVNLPEGATDISNQTFDLNVDPSKPNITTITGGLDNVWQNTIQNPTLTWTDPNSPSDDAFLITLNGSVPTTSNYLYRTTTNSKIFTTLQEGLTTINIRAINGAGTYGDTKTYIHKYDKTSPINVSNLKATDTTTNSTKLSWTNPTDSLSGLNNITVIQNNINIPANINDGIKIYSGTSNTVYVVSLKPSQKYYFTVFATDKVENISSGSSTVVKTLTPVIIEKPVPIDTPVTPPEEQKIETTANGNSFLETNLNSEYIETLIKKSTTLENTSIIEAKIKNNTKQIITENIRIQQKEDVEISIPNEIFEEDNSNPLQSVMIMVNNQIYPLKKQGNSYITSFTAPEVKGAYDINIVAIYQDNSVKSKSLSMLVDPYGYVYHLDKDRNEVRMKNISVSLYKIVEGQKVLWNGGENPVETNSNGEFDFDVEPGKYILVVKQDGYKPYQSEEFEVKNNIVNENILLIEEDKNTIFTYLRNWYITLPVVVILISGITIAIKKRK